MRQQGAEPLVGAFQNKGAARVGAFQDKGAAFVRDPFDLGGGGVVGGGSGSRGSL